MHRERRALDAGLFGVGRVEHLDGVVVLLGPADVHPHQHLGPVGGVHTTGAGADGHQRFPLVVLTGQQGPDFHRLDVGLQRLQLGVSFGEGIRGAVTFFLGSHLVEHRQVVETPPQAFDATQFALGMGQLAGDALSVALVVPQIRIGGLVLELLDLGAQTIDVEHSFHGRQGGIEGGDI